MRRVPWGNAVTIGLSVLVAGLLVATGWLGVVTMQKKAHADEQAKAVQAARQMGVNLMTLDNATAQRDIDRIVAGTTGELKNTLGAQAKTLLNQLAKTGAKSTVSEVDAAVVSMDDDSAEVMVSLNGTVTNAKVKDGAPRAYRYLMGLSRVHDRWLVSTLEMVP
ncbi:hypothetical protein [Actinomadura roseirufa]|uniref:hypothetical protein n=1 Tax=Actinomadura roseirufa TaxID=2094049 RepID=UPI00104186CB|nr:hypothetical protein [Actinomadura roseirufa]